MEQQEFDILFKEYYQSLFYLAYKLVKDKDAAEDIVTDTFIQILHEGYKHENEFKTKKFLSITTKNKCLNYLDRASMVDRKNKELLHTAEFVEYCDSLMIQTEVLRQIKKAYDTLPPGQKKVIQMLFIDELKPKDAAVLLGSSEDCIRVQKMKALVKMRQYFSNKKEL